MPYFIGIISRSEDVAASIARRVNVPPGFKVFSILLRTATNIAERMQREKLRQPLAVEDLSGNRSTASVDEKARMQLENSDANPLDTKTLTNGAFSFKHHPNVTNPALLRIDGMNAISNLTL